jgi:hypothetical protein
MIAARYRKPSAIAGPAEGWTVMSMKDDWNRIFPFGSK